LWKKRNFAQMKNFGNINSRALCGTNIVTIIKKKWQTIDFIFGGPTQGAHTYDVRTSLPTQDTQWHPVVVFLSGAGKFRWACDWFFKAFLTFFFIYSKAFLTEKKIMEDGKWKILTSFIQEKGRYKAACYKSYDEWHWNHQAARFMLEEIPKTV